MSNNDLDALLEAHEAIIVEREDAKHEFSDTSEPFPEGHVNGLNEARNRIEELIRNRCETDELDVAEYFQNARGLEIRGLGGGDSK